MINDYHCLSLSIYKLYNSFTFGSYISASLELYFFIIFTSASSTAQWYSNSRVEIAKRLSSMLRYQVRYSTALSASVFIISSAFAESPNW